MSTQLMHAPVMHAPVMHAPVMHAPGARVFSILILVVFVTSGCRSYGGQGAEEATYRQMQVAHQVFEEELVRARADLNKLQGAASDTGNLGVLATQYEQVVRGHEAVLDHHSNLIDDLSADSDYRSLHRTYAAIISQQRTIRSQYEGVLSHVRNAMVQQDTTQRMQRPYALIPPYYNRIAQQQRDVSVSRVLSEVRSGQLPATEAEIMTPASDADEAAGDTESDAGGGVGDPATDPGGGADDPATDPDASTGDPEIDPEASTGDLGIDGENQ